jgi:acetylornithine deacetylase/succinyl-diaminopimelate desuccinylase-like protein
MNPALGTPSTLELLRTLIQFDTTNPPGNEAACIHYLDGILTRAGFETTLFALDPHRPNLITRLPGQGTAPPLLMYGHVDVVTTEGQDWTHPPFEGRIVDGYLWGRGALDMKGAVAMMVAAILEAKSEGFAPPGDVVLAVVSDEEAGGEFGAKFLVDKHAEHFEGIRYAIGEAGAFTFHVNGSRLYPIMIAEKQICWLRATVRGRAGHGSMPIRGGAMAKLGRLLDALDRHRLPAHITPPARSMLEAIASVLPAAQAFAVRQLLKPSLTNRVLATMGSMGAVLDPMLHNTASPTILHGSSKVNVIPAEVAVELDGRLLPGLSPETMIDELDAILDDDVELEVVKHDPGPPEPDMGLYDTLTGILAEFDPGGVPASMLMPGVTDGRHFARLGIQTYGFTPMKMPAGFDMWKLAHGADERLPVDALDFGTAAIYQLLHRFGQAP